MIEVLIYCAFLIFTTFLSIFIKKNNSKKLNILLIIILAMIWSFYTITLPYNYSGDRLNYVTWFKQVYSQISIDAGLAMTGKELGWVIGNIILSNFIKSEYVMFYVYMIIPMSAVLFWIYSKKFTFYKANFILGTTLFPFYCTYLCRQMISVSIVIFATNFLEDRHYIRFIICIFISCLFHLSTIYIGVILLFLSLVKDAKHFKYISIISLLSIPLIPIIFSFINNFFIITKWSISNMEVSYSLIKAIPYFLLVIIFYIYNKNCKIQNNQINRNNVFNITLVFFIGFFWLLSGYQYWTYRLGIYFMNYYIFSIIPFIKLKKINIQYIGIYFVFIFNFIFNL